MNTGPSTEYGRRRLLLGLIAGLLLTGTLARSGLSSSPQSVANQPIVTNTRCPVLTDEEIDPNISVEYEGRQIFFCCQKCVKQFNADPTPFLANLVVEDGVSDGSPGPVPEATPPTNTGHDHGGESRGEHDHASHADAPTRGFTRWVHWVGRLHPMVVHFPIALLLFAALAELILIATGSPPFEHVARISLSAGALGALPAA